MLYIQQYARHYVLLALLNLSAAFDTVDHCILTERLSQSFAICDGVLDWLRDYLAGRRFTVRFGGTKSSPKDMQYSVPQGSVLGPLLFVLYTADLGSISVCFLCDRSSAVVLMRTLVMTSVVALRHVRNCLCIIIIIIIIIMLAGIAVHIMMYPLLGKHFC